MDKEEMQSIMSTIESDADLNDAENYRTVQETFAKLDIAYQLTRIAEALENMPIIIPPTADAIGKAEP